MNYTIFR